MALTVLQDTDCTFCRFAADTLARLDRRGALRFPGADGDRQLSDGSVLTHEQQLEEVHVIDEQGHAEHGYFAFRRIAAELPPLWPLVPFLYFPGAGLMGEPAYRWVSRHRDLMARLFRLG